jgi:hypothetical protein
VSHGVGHCWDVHQGICTADANLADGIAHAQARRALRWMRRTNAVFAW